MTALDVLTAVVRLACLLILAGTLGLAVREARDCHQRGMARVMRGRSWEARDCGCLSRLDRADNRRCGHDREAA